MTDVDFVTADFDDLLRAMPIERIEAWHDALDAQRHADLASDTFLAWNEGQKNPKALSQRRCLKCGQRNPPMTSDCMACGVELYAARGDK